MLEIYAKHGTSQKAAVWCLPNQRARILQRLREEYGGQWVWVDEVLTSGEILKFDDGDIYIGFIPDSSDRYSSAIKRLKLNG